MRFFEYKDKDDNYITLEECDTAEKTKVFKDFINKYHSYVKYKVVPQRRINWLVYNKNAEVIGAIGISSCVLCVKDRDNWIGWDKETRIKMSNQMANNYRFCLKPDTGIKNLGSRVIVEPASWNDGTVDRVCDLNGRSTSTSIDVTNEVLMVWVVRACHTKHPVGQKA